MSNPHNPHRIDVFWGELRPCEHAVQIYEDEPIFIEMLTSFVAEGLGSGDSAVMVATPAHRAAVLARLAALEHGFDRDAVGGRLVDLDAGETLQAFMRDGWPDESLFRGSILGLLGRARFASRTGKVRVFGEMVALLWAQGHAGATVRLEHLWHRLCEEEQFPLFCAYPKAGFTGDAAEAIQEVCRAHDRVVGPGTAVA